jgi:hypothetical protein
MFKDRTSAQHFVDKYQDQGHKESEDSLWVLESDPKDVSKDEHLKEKPRWKAHAQGRRKNQGGGGFPPLELTAPDPSTGNSKELFWITLGGDQQMIEKLIPPRLYARTKEALADATLDAIQLPGTSQTEVADNTGDLVGPLWEMTEDCRYDSTSDRPQKD